MKVAALASFLVQCLLAVLALFPATALALVGRGYPGLDDATCARAGRWPVTGSVGFTIARELGQRAVRDDRSARGEGTKAGAAP